ncbi:MAG: hypothetical protein DRP86_07420 [Candidatus Neomarinimicrobiota bacterium]|nr:MAG: hypothetical protein DRP86_07420 [Candidatus Neomarinimicrobiota bacterium]
MTEINITKSVLKNGLTIITENVPGVSSTAVGVFVKAGSIHERYEKSGIAHLIEHLVFKGSKKRSSFNIVDAIESKGGILNAYTEKDLTTFVARVLPRDVLSALDILCDMILNPEFSETHIRQEKSVILEEINDFMDTPQDYANESFIRKLYPDSSFGTYILGNRKSISRITPDDIRSFHRRYYRPANMVIVVSGALNPGDIVPFLNKHCGGSSTTENDEDEKTVPAVISRGFEWEEKDDIGQSHLIYGCHFPVKDRYQKYSFLLIQLMLSGGMSSRLFQHIREKFGFVYTIESFLDIFSGCGVFGVYAGTDTTKRYYVRDLIQQEIMNIRAGSVTESELTRIRMQFEGQLIISLENPENRMERIARHFISYGNYLTPVETMQLIQNIQTDDLIRMAQELQVFKDYNTYFLVPRN